MNEANQEMPRYKCHKEVHALKIRVASDLADDSLRLYFEETDFAPIVVDGDVRSRFKLKDTDGKVNLGYYVVYIPDGYVSWSPTKTFEDGYTRL